MLYRFFPDDFGVVGIIEHEGVVRIFDDELLEDMLGDRIDVLLGIVAESYADMPMFHEVFAVIAGICLFRLDDAFLESSRFLLRGGLFSSSVCLDHLRIRAGDVEIVIEVEVDERIGIP